jgi:hypothetical protein
MFFKGSRYQKVPTRIFKAASGREIAYKSTRFIPPTPAVEGHLVMDGDRLDNIAWEHFRDPLRYWRICDANEAMWPDDLLETGAVIRVPAAED